MMANQSMIMFPGQGAQRIGMCKSLMGSAEAKALFGRAEKVVGFNPLDVCLLEPEKFHALFRSTEFIQVMVFVTCLAKMEQIRKENPGILDNVACVAGLSLGEFTALVYSGAMTFEDALFVIKERGKAMHNIVSNMNAGLCNISGLSPIDLHTYLDKNFPKVEVATYLADEVTTIAGSKSDLSVFSDSLVQEFAEKQEKLRVKHLSAVGPFHTSYMKEAAEHFSHVLKDMQIRVSQPKVPIIMNVTGEIEDNVHDIKRYLSKQLDAPIKWKQSLITAYNLGVREFIEISPSKYLCYFVNMTKDISGSSTRSVIV